MPAFEFVNDHLSINVPAGQFTDALIDGWRITPDGTTAGRLDVVPWSEDRIAIYHARRRTHRRYGQHLRRFYRWLDPTEGRWAEDDEEDRARPRRVRLAAWIDGRFVVHPPDDRHKVLMNCVVLNSRQMFIGGNTFHGNTVSNDTTHGIRISNS